MGNLKKSFFSFPSNPVKYLKTIENKRKLYKLKMENNIRPNFTQNRFIFVFKSKIIVIIIHYPVKELKERWTDFHYLYLNDFVLQ